MMMNSYLLLRKENWDLSVLKYKSEAFMFACELAKSLFSDVKEKK